MDTAGVLVCIDILAYIIRGPPRYWSVGLVFGCFRPECLVCGECAFENSCHLKRNENKMLHMGIITIKSTFLFLQINVSVSYNVNGSSLVICRSENE